MLRLCDSRRRGPCALITSWEFSVFLGHLYSFCIDEITFSVSPLFEELFSWEYHWCVKPMLVLASVGVCFRFSLSHLSLCTRQSVPGLSINLSFSTCLFIPVIHYPTRLSLSHPHAGSNPICQGAPGGGTPAPSQGHGLLLLLRQQREQRGEREWGGAGGGEGEPLGPVREREDPMEARFRKPGAGWQVCAEARLLTRCPSYPPLPLLQDSGP